MIILMFIIFASFFGGLFIFMSIPSRDTRFNKVTISKTEYFKRWVALILCLIVFIYSLYAFLSCDKKAIAGAEKVAYLKTNNNEKLTPIHILKYFTSSSLLFLVHWEDFLYCSNKNLALFLLSPMFLTLNKSKTFKL